MLTPSEPVQTITVENDSAELSRVQLRVFAWRQVNGEDVLSETRDILANPALFQLDPGGRQIARFGLRATAGATEKAYRVVLEEVPTDRPSRPGEIRTLLRISIPIFVPATQPAPMQLAWRAIVTGPRQVTLRVRNDGNGHVQLNRLKLTRSAPGGGEAMPARDVSVYVLPGATRSVPLDLAGPIAAGQSLKLDAVTDQQNLSVALTSEASGREATQP